MFDAAAEFQSTSLHKNLLKGPDYLKNLVATLVRFHREKLGVMAYLEQMYHQIKV